MNNITQFLKEVRIELAKVTWPHRSQMISYTLAVLGLAVFVAAYLGVLDLVFQTVLNKFVFK